MASSNRKPKLLSGVTELSADALRAAEVLRFTDAIVGVYELDGELVMRNPAGDRVFGPQADFTATLEDRELATELLDSAARGEAFRLEAFAATMAGRRFHSMDGRPSVDPVTGRDVLIVNSIDITERQAGETIRDRFLSVINHELRTPLTALRGALIMLDEASDRLPGPGRDTLMQVARRNADRLNQLINELLDLRRLSSARLTLDREQVEICGWLRRVVAGCAHLSDSYKVSFEVEAPDYGVLIQAHPDKLRQAVVKLLDNAAKYSPPDATVQVRLVCLDDTVRLSVSDKGPGIPEAFRSQVFEHFTQAEEPNVRGRGGSGIGLHLARRLIEAHGGSIGFETAEGEGTTFWIRLPRAGVEQSAEYPAVSSSGSIRLR